jgi:hypothetical protein
MKEKRNSFQVLLVSVVSAMVILLVLAGCPKPMTRPVGEMPAQTHDDMQHPEMDVKSGELIAYWGKDRILKTEALVQDFKDKGIPGGNTDAQGNAVQVVMMTFYRSDGTGFVTDMQGHEIEPCARVINGKIVPIKGVRPCRNLFNTNITGIQKITINTHKSPDCNVDIWCNYALQRDCQ